MVIKWRELVRVKTILTTLYESQKDNTDEDFTPHGQACLETEFLSSGLFAVLYRAMRWQWAGLSFQMGSKKYCPWASEEWKEALDMCMSSEEKCWGLIERRRRRRRMCRDTQVGKLKIQTGLRPRFWGYFTLAQCCHEQMGEVDHAELMWANTQARLRFFSISGKVSVVSKVEKERELKTREWCFCVGCLSF